MGMSISKILIVEDDKDIRLACRDLLEGEGFAVETAMNGGDALAFLENHPQPCLILLDMLMPIMNGREFMTGLAKRPHTIVPIPVYLVSATANSNDGKEMGCLGFLKKPFNIDALISIVRTHCEMVKNGMQDVQSYTVQLRKLREHRLRAGTRPGLDR